MKKRLLLVNPVHREGFNASRLRLFDVPPTGLAYVAAATPEAEWDVGIVDENRDELDFDAPADLVGITSLTHNVNRAYEVASVFRARGRKVVMGGIHPSMLPEESLRYCDSVVIGEAEGIWGDVLRDFGSGGLRRMYRGLPAEMSGLVVPRREALRSRSGMANIQVSRGCPLNCEFCSVTAFNGGRYRRRPVDEVLAEMSGLKGRMLSFVDDNFGGLTPSDLAETKALLRGMIDRGFGFRWGTQTGLNYADDEELLELSRRSGCKILLVGIESVNRESLLGSARKGRVVKSRERVREAVRRIHDHGIAVGGFFVLGNDEDGPDVFEMTRDFVLDVGLDTSSFSISTPLPGTRLFRRMQSEGRLLCSDFPRDWKLFNFANVVFRPKRMTAEQLQAGLCRMYDETTGLGRSLGRAWKTLLMSKSPLSAAMCFGFNREFHEVNRLGHPRVPVLRGAAGAAREPAAAPSLTADRGDSLELAEVGTREGSNP